MKWLCAGQTPWKGVARLGAEPWGQTGKLRRVSVYRELFSKVSSASKNEDGFPPCPHFQHPDLSFSNTILCSVSDTADRPLRIMLTWKPGPQVIAVALPSLFQFFVLFEMVCQPPAASQCTWFVLGELVLLKPDLIPEFGELTERSECTILYRPLSFLFLKN